MGNGCSPVARKINFSVDIAPRIILMGIGDSWLLNPNLNLTLNLPSSGGGIKIRITIKKKRHGQ
jgi:hypothetical protein